MDSNRTKSAEERLLSNFRRAQATASEGDYARAFGFLEGCLATYLSVPIEEKQNV